jgi:NADPH-dependent curcumin reductase CurA
MTGTNRQITLASRPVGFPSPSDFKLIESPIPEPRDRQVLVRNAFVSVDPYQRGRMSDRVSYADPNPVGSVVQSGAVGRVVESRHDGYKEGEYVVAHTGWQEYGAISGSSIHKVDPDAAPLSAYLGVLGMPGLTAYFGLLEVGQPKEGETVLVSTAAGAVGSVVGQVARIKGCRVVGSAGSDAKVAHATNDLGYHSAFNYRNVTDYREKLEEECPDGVDVYFDNVGGPLTDAVFYAMNQLARLVICGQITQYNLEEPEMGPRLLTQLIGKGARVEGFLVTQFEDRRQEGIDQLANWIREGELRYRENVVEGIENTPDAFMGMLRGENVGKQVVKVADL